MEYKEPFFDKDLAAIILDRVKMRCKKLSEFIFKNAPDMIDTRKDIDSAMDNFRKDEIYFRLNREIERYKKAKRNHRHDYQSDIENARAGGKESLFRLIAWDKAWLFVPWVKERILEAQEERDAAFIKEIGAAVAKEPGARTVINAVDKDNRKAIFDLMAAVVSVAHEKYGDENMQMVIDAFHEGLFDSDILPEALIEQKEFMRQLQRHNVI